MFIILFAAIMLTGCSVNTPENTNSATQTKGAYQKLDQSTAKENLDSNKDIVLVDVRTPEEFAEERIPNSILIPDYDIEKLASEVLPDTNALIYIYCRSGRRSQAAAAALVDMGYTNVYDIGGIIDWEYETISGEVPTA